MNQTLSSENSMATLITNIRQMYINHLVRRKSRPNLSMNFLYSSADTLIATPFRERR